MNLLSTASTFSFFTLISRVLGYVRDILIAIFLGASIFADAFFVAFRLPNTFRRLFAEGTFNAAFIPSYTSAKIEDKKKGKKFADDVLNFLFLVLLFIVTLTEIFTPFLIYLIAPGFIETEMTEVLDEKVVEEWRNSIPLKRGGNPKDIAGTCVWLASDLSSYVTGQTIHVNGGLLT